MSNMTATRRLSAGTKDRGGAIRENGGDTM